jgi:hypothetical protein
LACESEIEYKDLTLPTDKRSLTSFQLLDFNPQIEMMIMFLWPIDLGPENEKEVIEIITTSRKISEDKERYLLSLNVLGFEYTQNNCDCHSYGLCEDDQEMNDEVLIECEKISSKQEENNLILANLTLDHELIKDKLNSLNAINIDVGVDDDYLDIGTYDLSSKLLKLNKFGYLGSERAVEFMVNPYLSQNMKAKFEFTVDDEIFSGDLGISNKQYNVIFSGEIETDSGQRGLIYWEHLK